MTAAPDTRDDQARIRSLEQEINLLRRRVAQREAALAQLNRRLRQLETGQYSGREGAGEAASLREALTALENTKTFRYTAGLRQVYRRLREMAKL